MKLEDLVEKLDPALREAILEELDVFQNAKKNRNEKKHTIIGLKIVKNWKQPIGFLQRQNQLMSVCMKHKPNLGLTQVKIIGTVRSGVFIIGMMMNLPVK